MIKQSRMKIEASYAAALVLAAIFGSIAAEVEAAEAQSAPAAATAPAKSPVTLKNNAQIERTEIDANGKERLVLKDPSAVIIVPGDRVVFTLHYENVSGEAASRFRAVNPMPAAIQFLSVNEDWAELSVDGGQNWGKLDKLTITQTITKPAVIDPKSGQETQAAVTEAITRSAQASDVTHVRWVFANPIPPGAKGQLSYRGLVK